MQAWIPMPLTAAFSQNLRFMLQKRLKETRHPGPGASPLCLMGRGSQPNIRPTISAVSREIPGVACRRANSPFIIARRSAS